MTSPFTPSLQLLSFHNFLTTSPHLLHIHVSFPCFGEKGGPGGEELLELGLGLLLAAVAAAGRAAPRLLEGRGFVGAAGRV